MNIIMGDSFKFYETLTGNEFMIYNLTKINDNHFVCVEGSTTLIVWKITNGYVKIRIPNAHNAFVNSLSMYSNEIIVSGSSDATIKFWNSDGKPLNTFYIGDGVLAVIKLQDGRIACGCTNKQILIFDHTRREIQRILKGHSDAVPTIIQLMNGCLVSCSYDMTIKMWDIESGKCLKTMNDHTRFISSLCALKSGGFVSASIDKTIKIWNEFGDCLRTITGHLGHVFSVIELSDGTIASGSHDKTIKIWNPTNGNCLQTMTGHTSSVGSLVELQDGIIVSGATDGAVNIWKRSKMKIARMDFVDIKIETSG